MNQIRSFVYIDMKGESAKQIILYL